MAEVRVDTNRCRAVSAALVFAGLAACRPSAGPPQTARSAIPVWRYEVIRSFPHDPDAFTQGLQFHNGYLYESTGRHGHSSLRKVEIETGRVLRRFDLSARFFGEGLAIVGDRIYMLTWQEKTGFIFDLETFASVGRFSYEGEGWGLAYDGRHLIMSDGTSRLRFMNPEGFRLERVLDVTAGGVPVKGLNELAWIEGEIWANVWPSDWLVRIRPDTGAVIAWVDLTGLLHPRYVKGPVDVLNGIAYDPRAGRLFVTGKLWPRLFEIRLIE